MIRLQYRTDSCISGIKAHGHPPQPEAPVLAIEDCILTLQEDRLPVPEERFDALLVAV
jgi:hypothetical protein